jgi:hypothetical protein
MVYLNKTSTITNETMSRPNTRSNTAANTREKHFTNLEAHRTKSTKVPSSEFSGVQLPHSASEIAESYEIVDKPTQESQEAHITDTTSEMAPPGDKEERREQIKKMITSALMSRGCVPDEFAMEQLLAAHAVTIEDSRAPVAVDTNYLSIFSQGWALSQRRFSDMALDNLKKTIEPLVSTLAVTSNNLKGVSDSMSHTSKLLRIRTRSVNFQPSTPQQIAKRLEKMRGKLKVSDDMMDPVKALPEPTVEDYESETEDDEAFPVYNTEVLKETWNKLSLQERNGLFNGFVKAALGVDTLDDVSEDDLVRYKQTIKGQWLTTAFIMKEERMDREKILKYIKSVWAENGLEDTMETGE